MVRIKYIILFIFFVVGEVVYRWLQIREKGLVWRGAFLPVSAAGALKLPRQTAAFFVASWDSLPNSSLQNEAVMLSSSRTDGSPPLHRCPGKQITTRHR